MAGRPTASILVENSPAEDLLNEHGLSVHIAYGETNVLLDFGQSEAFARNARALGIGLAAVDLAVLSHAHYDHADGMGTFFALNDHAPLYLSDTCAENCWSTKGGTTAAHYIGVKEGSLGQYRDRLVPVSATQVTTLAPGVHLVPHTTPDLAAIGAKAGMLTLKDGALVADDFSHEMSLVLELPKASSSELAVFSSCSHAGLPVILNEVQAAFPARDIAAFVGGLHLVHASDADILSVARAIAHAGVGRVYTGHCTGARAFELLSRELPDRIVPLRPGRRITL